MHKGLNPHHSPEMRTCLIMEGAPRSIFLMTFQCHGWKHICDKIISMTFFSSFSDLLLTQYGRVFDHKNQIKTKLPFALHFHSAAQLVSGLTKEPLDFQESLYEFHDNYVYPSEQTSSRLAINDRLYESNIEDNIEMMQESTATKGLAIKKPEGKSYPDHHHHPDRGFEYGRRHGSFGQRYGSKDRYEQDRTTYVDRNGKCIMYHFVFDSFLDFTQNTEFHFSRTKGNTIKWSGSISLIFRQT